MTAAYSYCRVSTELQAVEGVSLDAQQSKAAAWCICNDVPLAESFVDAGLSGKRADNRPALQRALDAVCAAKGVLVVYSLSRLARSTKDTIAIAERLEKAGANLVSLSEKIDTTTAAGKMVFRMLAVLAEFERDQISERTTGAMAHKRAKGERIGTVPFGFDCTDGVNLEPNAAEQETLGLISDLRAAGYSLRKIAAELKARGVTTKSGGNDWQANTLKRILERTAA